MEHLSDLADYMEWANTRTAQMLQQTPTDDGTGILAHLLAADNVWASRILEEPCAMPLRPDWTLEQCREYIPISAARYRAIGKLPEQSIRYQNTKGEAFVSQLSEIVQHVFSHGAYHRGQISQAVSDSGGDIIDTDYILFHRR